MSKKLLLADDSITIQKVIGITFAHEDYSLTIADNGETALSKAREERPDLILADVVMPGKNGYELCAAVKQDHQLRHIPVLLLTGTFEPFDEAKAKAAGADSWLSKPFESQSLINRVEELLARAAAAPPPSPEPVSSAPPVLDAEAAPAAVLTIEPQAEADLWAEMDGLDDLDSPAADGGSEGLWEEPAIQGDELWGGASLGEGEAAGEPAADDWSGLAAEVDNDLSVEEPAAENGSGLLKREEAAVEFSPEAPAAEIESREGQEEAAGPIAEWAGFEEDILPLDESDILEEEELEEIAAPAEFRPSGDLDQESADDFLFEEEEAGASREAFLFGEDTSDDTEDEFLFEDELADPTAAEYQFEEEAGALEEFGFVAPGDSETLPEDEFLFEEEAFAFDGELPPIDESEWALPEGEAGLESSIPGAVFTADLPAGPPPELREASFPKAAADSRSTLAPAAAVEEKIGALSDDQVARIVEKMIGPVIERLASTMLEKIAWEVVPDLAESMIRDEIRKIRESVAR